jgi:uncharacterized protein YkwD
MARFLLFVGIIFSIIAIVAGKGLVWGIEKQPVPVVENAPTFYTASSTILKSPAVPKNAAPVPVKKTATPIAPAPSKTDEPVLAAKAEPKVATPLVHYTVQNKAPNSLLSEEVVTWTNTYRQQNGLKGLQRNEKLDAAAVIKAHDMFVRQYFAHESPTGKNSADLVSGVGYEHLVVGENLALGIFSDEKELVDAWMASPGHRANILNSRYEEIGIGIEEGTYEGKHVWMAVQEFGKPASSCPAPEASLKTAINENRAKISELSAQVHEIVSEMNTAASENNASLYNQKVSEYNALISAKNLLVQNNKSIIDVYNGEINAYNACIGV